LKQDATFDAFATLTIDHAAQRFGAEAADTVQQAWAQVGIE